MHAGLVFSDVPPGVSSEKMKTSHTPVGVCSLFEKHCCATFSKHNRSICAFIFLCCDQLITSYSLSQSHWVITGDQAITRRVADIRSHGANGSGCSNLSELSMTRCWDSRRETIGVRVPVSCGNIFASQSVMCPLCHLRTAAFNIESFFPPLSVCWFPSWD